MTVWERGWPSEASNDFLNVVERRRSSRGERLIYRTYNASLEVGLEPDPKGRLRAVRSVKSRVPVELLCVVIPSFGPESRACTYPSFPGDC